MIVGIADTHAALWYLFSDARLGSNASSFIDAAVASGDHIGISAISVAEMVYLIEKGRIAPTALTDLTAATADPNAVFQRLPLDHDIALKMTEVSRQEVPDLPDRVIAATALFYGVPASAEPRFPHQNICGSNDLVTGHLLHSPSACPYSGGAKAL